MTDVDGKAHFLSLLADILMTLLKLFSFLAVPVLY